MVQVVGLEPTASCSQSMPSTNWLTPGNQFLFIITYTQPKINTKWSIKICATKNLILFERNLNAWLSFKGNFKASQSPIIPSELLVPGTGVEPARCYQHWIFLLLYVAIAEYKYSLQSGARLYHINYDLGSWSMLSTHLFFKALFLPLYVGVNA